MPELPEMWICDEEYTLSGADLIELHNRAFGKGWDACVEAAFQGAVPKS